jgi:hypothetical protein
MMYRKVDVKDIVFDIIYKMDIEIDMRDWDTIYRFVQSVFVTRCNNSIVELEMVIERSVEVLRFFIKWEMENRGRDMDIILPDGKEVRFRMCRVDDIDIGCFGGDAIRLAVRLKHSGAAIRR